jgi:hypothetical protein
MKILKALFLLPLFLLFWNISNAYFDITNYEIKWDIKIDWTIDINEKIDTHFYSQMHWIERILNRYYSVDNLEFQVLYDDIKVNNDNFTTYDEYWDAVVRIWDADKLVFGDHEYDIDYSMYWVIRNFSWMGYSELYWNPIWYKRDVNIKGANIELNLVCDNLSIYSNCTNISIDGDIKNLVCNVIKSTEIKRINSIFRYKDQFSKNKRITYFFCR